MGDLEKKSYDNNIKLFGKTTKQIDTLRTTVLCNEYFETGVIMLHLL